MSLWLEFFSMCYIVIPILNLSDVRLMSKNLYIKALESFLNAKYRFHLGQKQKYERTFKVTFTYQKHQRSVLVKN